MRNKLIFTSVQKVAGNGIEIKEARLCQHLVSKLTHLQEVATSIGFELVHRPPSLLTHDRIRDIVAKLTFFSGRKLMS